jgi:hypothetical protein
MLDLTRRPLGRAGLISAIVAWVPSAFAQSVAPPPSAAPPAAQPPVATMPSPSPSPPGYAPAQGAPPPASAPPQAPPTGAPPPGAPPPGAYPPATYPAQQQPPPGGWSQPGSPPAPGPGYGGQYAPPPTGYYSYGVEPRYVETTRPRKGLLIPGAIIFGIFYGIALLSMDAHSPVMAIPVAGPFVDAAGANDCFRNLDFDSSTTHCHDEGDDTVVTWIGASQLIGATLFGLAFAFPVTVRERVEVGTGRVGEGQGLVFSGSF